MVILWSYFLKNFQKTKKYFLKFDHQIIVHKKPFKIFSLSIQNNQF